MTRFIVGWMVSAWCLAEILVFFPSLGPVFYEVESFLSIPTHDKWNLVRIREERDWLEQQMGEAKSLPLVRSVFNGLIRGHFSASLTNFQRSFTSDHSVSLGESFFASDELHLLDSFQDLSRHT